MSEKKVNYIPELADPSFRPGYNLELDGNNRMITALREPAGAGYPGFPLKPSDTPSKGTVNAYMAFAMFDHVHPRDDDFSGATSETAGGRGLVPQPGIGEQNYLLSGGGGWVNPNIPTPADSPGLAPVDGGATGSNLLQFALEDHRHDLEPVFTGAGVSSQGTRGAVPAPNAGDNDAWLKGNGSWDHMSFLYSTDTPSSYSGKAWQVVRVKLDESGLEFYDAPLPSGAQNVSPKPTDDTGAVGSVSLRYALEDHRHPLPDVMVGATVGTAGVKGLVPGANAGQFNRFLSGAGEWRGEFSTLYPGLCPKVTAQDIADNAVLLASGFWGGIGFTDLHDTPNVIENRLAFVRVKYDLSGFEYFLPYSAQVGLPVKGEYLQPSSGASAGVAPEFAKADHSHDFIVFAGPGTDGGVGAVPSSTTSDVTNGRFLRADGAWAIPSVTGGGGATGIPESTITAKGDLIVGTGAATYGVLGVAANGWVLTADSAATFGVKWSQMTVPVAGTGIQALGESASNGTSANFARVDHVHPLPAIYQGATAVAAGVKGLVPPANAGQQAFLLTGSGTYVAPPGSFTGPGTSGLIPDPGEGQTNLWLKSTGWSALNFLSLADTPGSYSGTTGQVAYSTGSGIAFKSIDAATATPQAPANAGSVGASTKYARENHVHPISAVFTQTLRGTVPPPVSTPSSLTPRFMTDAGSWVGLFGDSNHGLVPNTNGEADKGNKYLNANGGWSNPFNSIKIGELVDVESALVSGSNANKVLVVNDAGNQVVVKSAVPAESITAVTAASINSDIVTLDWGANSVLTYKRITGITVSIPVSQKGKYLVSGVVQTWVTKVLGDAVFINIRASTNSSAALDPNNQTGNNRATYPVYSAIPFGSVKTVVSIPFSHVIDLSGITSNVDVFYECHAVHGLNANDEPYGEGLDYTQGVDANDGSGTAGPLRILATTQLNAIKLS